MKLYCFYKYNQDMTKEQYRSKIENGLSQEDIYPIYALTNKKKFMKRFKQERDMNKFILFVKDDDEEEIKVFMNQRRSTVLDLYKYRYIPKNQRDKEQKIEILSTYEEYNMTSSLAEDGSMILDELFNLPFSNPFVFKDKYLDALRLLDYDTIFKFQFDKDINRQYITVCGRKVTFNDAVPEDEGFPETPNIILDEFGIFIHTFGDLFK